jgi:toxin ParE1/3/4
MSGRYVLSRWAQTDLEEIWDYAARRWGLDQAESSTRDLWNRIERIATTPALGQGCPNLRAGYFKIAYGSHVPFYGLTSKGVDVVRICMSVWISSATFLRHSNLLARSAHRGSFR